MGLKKFKMVELDFFKKEEKENIQVSLDGTNVNFYNLAGVFTDLIIHENKEQ